LVLSKADAEANSEADKLAGQIRQSNKLSLDDLARQYHMTVGETRPVAPTDAILELGSSPSAARGAKDDVKDEIFRLRQGDLSLPIHTDRGYVVLSVKQILPAHQGSLQEVRDKVVTELKQQKAGELAQQRANDLEKRVKAGEKFDAAAKALGLDPKTSDSFARNGSIGGGPSGKQLSAAFQMKPGDVAAPLNLGASWIVYRVAEKEEPNPADFDKQKKDITDQVLQSKRTVAFDAFKTALENRLKQEGKLSIMPDKLKNFGDVG
jgi:peptidyl-prolyl cis-trans isomerase D